MKKLLALGFMTVLLLTANLCAVNYHVENLPGNGGNPRITVTYDDGSTNTFEQQGEDWVDADGVRVMHLRNNRGLLNHLNQALEQAIAAAAPVAEVPVPAAQAVVPADQNWQQRVQQMQQWFTQHARNVVLRWGSPIRFDVNPLEALRNEILHRPVIAWNRAAIRTFFIVLGEVTVFYCLMQVSNDLGSYSDEINSRLIPALNPNTYVNTKYASPGMHRFSVAGSSLASLYMMSLIQSYTYTFGIHAAEDLFCLIGSTAWGYLQSILPRI